MSTIRKGTVYSSKLYDGRLYIGTNQGLFYKEYKGNGEFKFIDGTKGQVWSLFEYDGTLFCGHDSGTFIIEKASVKIYSENQLGNLNRFPVKRAFATRQLLWDFGIEKVNNQWRFRK
jgi:ligand-binding sensor domain-containing protein